MILLQIFRATSEDIDLLRAFDVHPRYEVESKHMHDWESGCAWTLGWNYRVIDKLKKVLGDHNDNNTDRKI